MASLRTIYETVELQNNELSYNEYALVVTALEWKYKSGYLSESITNDTDLIYWVETVRNNNAYLNEWSVNDFTNLIKKTKEKAATMGQNAMLAATTIVEKFKQSFAATYEAFLKLANEFKLDMNSVFQTLREEGLFAALKETKNLITNGASNLFNMYTTAYAEASDMIFGTLAKTDLANKLELATDKIDQLIKNNPKLKYVLGPVIAYTLYYIWTQMIFKGDFIYDFDWSTNIKALLGDFDLKEIFAGRAGVELLTWFGLGLTGMFPSAAWLDGELSSIFNGWGNHVLAMLATLLIIIHKKSVALFNTPLIQAVQKKMCHRNSNSKLKPHMTKALTDMALKKKLFIPITMPKCSN